MAVNFTKQAIANSFMKLLNEKPLDKITVKDIVEDCEINRNTFYYHYQDIYALLQEIFESESEKYIMKHKNDATWEESFLEAIEFLLQNKKAIFHIFYSIKREVLEDYLFEVSDVFMEQVVVSEAKGLNVSNEDLRYVIIFYKHALLGIVIEWLHKGMKDEPERVIKRMGEIFDGNLRYILEKISKN